MRKKKCTAIKNFLFFYVMFVLLYRCYLTAKIIIIIIVFPFRLQGAILTTMLATRNFSSKYDAQGKYLRPSSALYTDHDRQYFYIFR